MKTDFSTNAAIQAANTNHPCVCVCVCVRAHPFVSNYSPPCSSIHGIFQAGILERLAISYSRESF